MTGVRCGWKFPGPAALKVFRACGAGTFPGPAALKISRACGAGKYTGPAALGISRACGAGEFPGPVALKKSAALGNVGPRRKKSRARGAQRMMAPSTPGHCYYDDHMPARSADFFGFEPLKVKNP